MQSIPSHIQPAATGTYPQQRSIVDAKSNEKSEKQAGAKETEAYSVEEQRQIQSLKARDTEVRAHEQAHLSAAGGIAIGGANFTFQTGPDGNRYAIGGEVPIDISPVPGDPEATLKKAEIIRRAALAPASPSSQDYSVASRAASMSINARIELMKQNQSSDDNHQNTASIGTRIDISA